MHKTPRKCQLSKLEQDASVLRPLDVRASYHSCMAEGMAVEDSFRRPAQLRLPNFACETWAGEGI